MTYPTEQYQPTRWSLDSILAAPTGPPVDETLASLETAVLEIEELRPLLAPDIDAAIFSKAISTIETITVLGNRCGRHSGKA